MVPHGLHISIAIIYNIFSLKELKPFMGLFSQCKDAPLFQNTQSQNVVILPRSYPIIWVFARYENFRYICVDYNENINILILND